MNAIIGIGNLNKYTNTRHSIGIYFINKLLKKINLKLIFNKDINGFYCIYNINNIDNIIYIPNSYINNCGYNIKKLLEKYNIKNNNLIVIHDDIYFLPGISKMQFNISDGGHNGIKDIIYNLNSKMFYRIRIGIGKPKLKNFLNNFVLLKPTNLEKKLIDNSINKCIISIFYFINNNPNFAMNYLNRI
ncbi:peptidyl-tRNA hydrolase [endosymbiont of Euscepes postfasciatus]|uniref:aminoacyl-tRNA hydrolase n=1 Tax=endosymbiont of Euscepes postfasciatus TaxID=650377 RepID=UPI000DC6DB67|nr:aminoacyl-tRNA hydrolase [endosymbiont of Euscepes postfasciatus]BBA84654.1 peptidyl-tRNA hydrolase [endosymbiont of Euscepes postfasciatus]